MNFIRSTLVAALVGFSSLAQAQVTGFISRLEVNNTSTAYNFRVYLKDVTTGNALAPCSGGTWAYVNRGGNESDWFVRLLMQARGTLQPVTVYSSLVGSGCLITDVYMD